MSELCRRLAFLFWRRRFNRELEEEMRMHVELAGAQRRFGNVTLFKEVSREMWGWHWLETIAQDLRYGARTMRKNPGFAAVAVLSLALGIGANTAIFSLTDAALLKMLPVQRPEEIYIVAHSGKNPASSSSNYPFYEFLRDRLQSFSGLCSFWPVDVKIKTDSGVEPASAQFVTVNYFSVLGVQTALGRGFAPGDDREPVAVISHGYWGRRFARDRGVLGKTLVVNGTPLTIIGVTAPEFFGLQPGSPIDVSIPLASQPRVLPEYGNRLTIRDGWWSLWILGRLKPNIAARQARAEMDVFFRQWVSELKLPSTMTQYNFTRGELLSGSSGLNTLRSRFSKPLQVLMSIVGVVLLIACANIASLLTARSAARQREIAIRLAVGAGRTRVVRQLLTESFLLAAIGGAAGVFLAWYGSHLVISLISSGAFSVRLDLDPDPRVLAFTAAISVLTGILFGLAPALHATSPRPQVSASPRRFGLARLLVVAQVALSLILLIGATLFVLSLRNIKALDAGFRTEGLLLITFDPDGAGYRGERRAAFYRDAVERVSQLPGVLAASMSSLGPLSADDNTRFISVPGFTARSIEDQTVHENSIAPRFFETMGIPALAGREFTARDHASAARVAVLNETAARFYFRDTDPLGKIIVIGRQPPGPPIEIVGVVKDSKRNDLREAPPRMVYVPFLQALQPYMTLVARTTGDPAALALAVRAALSAFNADIPIRHVRTAKAQIDSTLVRERLVATLSGFFGCLALLLCSVGLYGLMAYTVARRTSEIGIRMALGANRGHALWLVLREAGGLVLLGCVAGVSAAAALNRLIANMLYGLTPAHPSAYVLASVILLSVAGIAAYLPARRASRVDPIVALRHD